MNLGQSSHGWQKKRSAKTIKHALSFVEHLASNHPQAESLWNRRLPWALYLLCLFPPVSLYILLCAVLCSHHCAQLQPPWRDPGSFPYRNPSWLMAFFAHFWNKCFFLWLISYCCWTDSCTVVKKRKDFEFIILSCNHSDKWQQWQGSKKSCRADFFLKPQETQHKFSKWVIVSVTNDCLILTLPLDSVTHI